MCSVISVPVGVYNAHWTCTFCKFDNYISTKVWIPSLRFPGCSHTFVFWSTPDVQPDFL